MLSSFSLSLISTVHTGRFKTQYVTQVMNRLETDKDILLYRKHTTEPRKNLMMRL